MKLSIFLSSLLASSAVWSYPPASGAADLPKEDETERFVLEAFDGIFTDDEKDLHYCQVGGIECDTSSGPPLIREIDFTHFPRARGTIPTEIGLLTKLEFITFRRLNGTLPTEIGLLTNLQELEACELEKDVPLQFFVCASRSLP